MFNIWCYKVKIREIFLKGLDFTQKNILKLGIICLGIQLKPFAFLEFGKIAIPLIIICIVSVLLVIKLISTKIIIPKRMSYLISVGSTVCGTTAIMAMAPVINAKKNEEKANQILDFTKQIKNTEEEDKKAIIEALWSIIYSDEEDWEEDESPQQECHDFYDSCLEFGIDEETCAEGWLECVSGPILM